MKQVSLIFIRIKRYWTWRDLVAEVASQHGKASCGEPSCNQPSRRRAAAIGRRPTGKPGALKLQDVIGWVTWWCGRSEGVANNVAAHALSCAMCGRVRRRSRGSDHPFIESSCYYASDQQRPPSILS